MENSKKIKSSDKICQFIHKLVDMMENFQEYFYWGNSEDELIIDKLKEVEERVLSKYFRHTKLSSFIRQLNIYGFCKMEHKENLMKFSHKIFKRGNLCQFASIKRKSKLNEKQKEKIPQNFLNLLNLSKASTQTLVKSLTNVSKLHTTLTSLSQDMSKLASLDSLLPEENSLVTEINLQLQQSISKFLPQSKKVSDLLNQVIDSPGVNIQNEDSSNINEECSFEYSLKQRAESKSQISEDKKYNIIGQGLERAIQQQNQIYRFVVAMEDEQLYSLEN